MIADWAVHYKPGEVLAHAHLLVTARSWRSDRSSGRRHPRWMVTQQAIRAAKRACIDISGLRPTSSFVLP